MIEQSTTRTSASRFLCRSLPETPRRVEFTQVQQTGLSEAAGRTANYGGNTVSFCGEGDSGAPLKPHHLASDHIARCVAIG